jgi:hypothetical protein
MNPIEQQIKKHPPEIQHEVEDFVEFLMAKQSREHGEKSQQNWNISELISKIEQLVEIKEKEFMSKLDVFVSEMTNDEKNFAQKYSEIQMSYLGALETKESYVVTLGIFVFSIGVSYLFASNGYNL